MNKEDADKVVSALLEKRLFSKEKVNDYLDSQGYLKDKHAMIQILSSMVERSEISWGLFINDLILDVATESTAYVNLLSEIARKNMWILSKLTELYINDPI